MPDPYRSFNFRVEIDGVPSGGFTDCSGLTADIEAVDYREGTDVRSNNRRLPGRSKFGPITLKRGYTKDLSLWRWYLNVYNGVNDRRNVTIILQDEEHKPVMRFHAEKAFPTKIEAPMFKAGASEVAVESLELNHEGLSVEV